MTIPSEIRAALERRERSALCRAIVKILLFYLIAAVLLYVIATQEGSKFSPTAFPIAFWTIVVAVVVSPLLRHRLWRYMRRREVRGTVLRKRDRSLNVANATPGRIRSFRAWDMWEADAVELAWTNERGAVRKMNILRPDRAAHARVYYQEGDRITLPRCAAVPFNEDRLPPHPICLGCGFVAKNHEEYCGVCGLALLQERADENAVFDEAAQAAKEEQDDAMNWWESRS
ncbi:MAG: hypothetical protein J6R04_07990 [Clostridia bacterium]|nr:hypothetical protein [Clostridia bacterium]